MSARLGTASANRTESYAVSKLTRRRSQDEFQLMCSNSISCYYSLAPFGGAFSHHLSLLPRTIRQRILCQRML